MTEVLRVELPEVDVMCGLDAATTRLRLEEWRVLRGQAALRVETIPGGARLWLRVDAVARARDLVGREARCCAFLDFEVVLDVDCVRVDISATSLEGAQVAATLAGLDTGSTDECSGSADTCC